MHPSLVNRVLQLIVPALDKEDVEDSRNVDEHADHELEDVEVGMGLDLFLKLAIGCVVQNNESTEHHSRGY